MWAFFGLILQRCMRIWKWSWGFSLQTSRWVTVCSGHYGKGSMRVELFAAGPGEFHHHQRSLWRFRQGGRFPSCNGRCQPCPIWQVIQTCRISQCLWWTWAWIPYLQLSSGIACRQWDGEMGCGDFLMNFIFWMPCLTRLFLIKKTYLFGPMHKVTNYQAIGLDAAKSLVRYPLFEWWLVHSYLISSGR